jgi:uncharacterized BrkB/YihY/UPF0761 family membrane protein
VDPPPDDESITPSEKARLRDRAAALRDRAQDLGAKAQERLEVEQSQRGWVRTVVLAWQADRDRGGGLLAGGLAYRIFIWMLPAMLLVVSALNVVARLSGDPPITTVRRSGMAAEVAKVIAEAASAAGSAWWWLAIVGLVLMVWAGRGVVKALWLVGQIAWQRREARPKAVVSSLAFSGLLLAGLAAPVVLSSLIQGPFFVDVVEWILATLVVLALTLFGVGKLPRGGRPWVAIVPGVVVFVVVQRAVTIGSAVYFSARLEGVDDLYGGIGVAIVVMLWLYVTTRIYVGTQFLNATIAGVPTGALAGSIGEDVAEVAPAGDDASRR